MFIDIGVEWYCCDKSTSILSWYVIPKIVQTNRSLDHPSVWEYLEPNQNFQARARSYTTQFRSEHRFRVFVKVARLKENDILSTNGPEKQ